ncbi:hypothetical protein CQW23_05999 [Capsicum baccatum]|uniref:Ubiquitin-like protease family profile domain-containing protein n=1 Tax=Capsicum baccatum TaxID=33114 RepID=A0A2G2X215_CAPBA|nr:hypothetical protein CQW23_05999 [Capsicum baccatum]
MRIEALGLCPPSELYVSIGYECVEFRHVCAYRELYSMVNPGVFRPIRGLFHFNSFELKACLTAWAFDTITYLRQQVNYQEEVSCLRILRWLSSKTDKNGKFVDLFIPSKKAVVDEIKMELFGATTITRKIILKGRLVAVDDGSSSGAAVGDSDAPLIVFEIISHYDYDHIGCTDFSPNFSTSSKYSACKCQDCRSKHDRVINAINAINASIKKMSSKKGVIPSKRISYPYTPLEIKVAKRRRKISSRHHQALKKVDVTVEATTEEHNIIIDNPSTTYKKEEKVEPISLGEQKNYPFEGFNISNEAPKKLTQLINNYSEWIADGLLKHHASFSIPAGLPWYFVDQVYIPINCGDEFHWVLAVIILKKRRIRVYDSISRKRHFGPLPEIQKMAKILLTYLDMSGFLNQKVRTDWSTIEAYQDKMGNPFDIQYVEAIA